mmetsp:Transcript_19658/g.30809  ORF Transcript_19658/g.30809 Transcript_19658/m.30809 type:complete len:101 (-) Transcript_19658:616-918(-)
MSLTQPQSPQPIRETEGKAPLAALHQRGESSSKAMLPCSEKTATTPSCKPPKSFTVVSKQIRGLFVAQLARVWTIRVIQESKFRQGLPFVSLLSGTLGIF